MIQVLLQGPAVHKYIIEEDYNALPEQWMKSAVHSPLEGVRCASQLECHNSEFKMTPVHLECSFVLFPRRQPDLVEACSEI